MDLVHLWLFLHIAIVFLAVTIAVGTTLFLRVAYMTGQVAAVRGVGMVAGRLGPAVPVLFVAAGVFGLLTAISTGTNLLAPWLLIAYTGFVIALVIGFIENKPFGERLGKLLPTVPDGPIEGELKAMFTDRRGVWLTVIEYIVIVTLIFDMVVKPFE